MRKLVAEEADLTKLPAIGKEMAKHIEELVTTGRATVLEELSQQVPCSLIQLMRLPGLGPRKAARLWAELGIETGDVIEIALGGQTCSDLEIHMIRECGHWTQQEKPDELNHLLIDWLTRHT